MSGKTLLAIAILCVAVLPAGAERPNVIFFALAEDAAYAAVKDELRRSAPDTFAPAGIPKNRLKLVTQGETFHWRVK